MTTSPRPLSDQMITIPGRDWRLLAACRHADPDLFFPVSGSGPSLDQVIQAKVICAGCPVRLQCLAFALATRQDHGVWGGMSEEERRPRQGKRLPGPDTRARPRRASPAADPRYQGLSDGQHAWHEVFGRSRDRGWSVLVAGGDLIEGVGDA
jgi:WhiB family redox-sensing transcriptional regulator